MLTQWTSGLSNKFHRRLLLILGMTGFGTTVTACYGPPAYIPDELPANEQNMIFSCMDGTTTNTRCPDGCLQSRCLQKGGDLGESCEATHYLETCSSEGDKKLTCSGGIIQEKACQSCQSNDTGVTCQNSDNADE